MDGGTITEEKAAQGLIHLSESSPKTCALALYSSICRDFGAVSTWQKTMIQLLADLITSEVPGVSGPKQERGGVPRLALLLESDVRSPPIPTCAPERSCGW